MGVLWFVLGVIIGVLFIFLLALVYAAGMDKGKKKTSEIEAPDIPGEE